MAGGLAKLEALSRSAEYSDRARAAKLAAAADAAETEAIVLRLLRDPWDTAVTQAMVEGLLEQRGAAAIPLVLRSLGTPAGDDYDESGEQMVWSLLGGRQRGIDIEGAVVAALIESSERAQTLGALDAIGWMSPLGTFSLPAVATELLEQLAAGSDGEVAELARYAREGIAEGAGRGRR